MGPETFAVRPRMPRSTCPAQRHLGWCGCEIAVASLPRQRRFLFLNTAGGSAKTAVMSRRPWKSGQRAGRRARRLNHQKWRFSCARRPPPPPAGPRQLRFTESSVDWVNVAASNGACRRRWVLPQRQRGGVWLWPASARRPAGPARNQRVLEQGTLAEHHSASMRAVDPQIVSLQNGAFGASTRGRRSEFRSCGRRRPAAPA